jgi:hypothetical protein
MTKVRHHHQEIRGYQNYMASFLVIVTIVHILFHSGNPVCLTHNHDCILHHNLVV